MSSVRVAHIDCTTTGASPPTRRAPIAIWRVARRAVACSISSNSVPGSRSVTVCLVIVGFARRGRLLVAHLHRDRRRRELRAGPQRHRNEGRLGYFLVRRALLDRALDVILDAPGTGGDMRRRYRHQLLGLGRQRAILENHLIPVHETLEVIGLELAQLAQALNGFFAEKIGHRRSSGNGATFSIGPDKL